MAAGSSNPRSLPPEVSGFVLAGGRSARLGQDKVLLPWAARAGQAGTLLDHAVARLREVCSSVSVCASRVDLPQYEPLIRDAIPGAGPLGGMVAALEQSRTDWNLFLAVDLPLVPVELLEALTASVRKTQTAQGGNGKRRPSACFLCLIPYLAGMPQPLCAVYHSCLAEGLRHALEAGTYKVMQALGEATARPSAVLRPSEGITIWPVEDFAPVGNDVASLSPAEWFLNLNTSEDWLSAERFSAAVIRGAGASSLPHRKLHGQTQGMSRAGIG